MDTSNILLWGGSKSLMGYNKHHIGNAMVYVDYTPALNLPPDMLRRLGWSAPSMSGKPPMCTGMITPTPAVPGLSEVWSNNTCIASSPASLFRWPSCNSSNPLDGSIPVPLSNNRYFTPNATYQMRCNGATWGFEEAQQRGLDLGSTLHPLPDTEALMQLMRALLGF